MLAQVYLKIMLQIIIRYLVAFMMDAKSKDEIVTKQFRDHLEDCIDLLRFQLRNKLETFHIYDGLGVQMRSDIFDKIILDCYE